MLNVEIIIPIIFIFLLPGYVISASFLSKKLDLPEFIFLKIMLSVIISGGMALVLAESGYFSLANLTIILGLICLVLFLLRRRKFNSRPFNAKINHTVFASLILLILCILFFAPPFEWTTGDSDPGIYFNIGVHTSNTGSLIIYDNWIANITPAEKDLFLAHGIQLMIGFQVSDFDIGKVTPLLFHMWPTWIATFHSIFGLLQSLYVTPFFGTLSVITIFFLTKRLFNWKIGLISSSLLSLNFVQIFFSKIPASEMLTQFLIFAGLYFIALSKEQNHKVFPILSALCFTEALITRIDSMLILAPIFLYFLFVKLSGKWREYHQYFINSFCLFLIFYFLYVNHISYQYFFPKLHIILHHVRGYELITFFNLSFLITLVLLSIAFNLNFNNIKKFLAKKLELNRLYLTDYLKSYAKYFLMGFIFIVFSYFYFFRPSLTSNIVSDDHNIIKLSWYLWGPAIWLGILGSITILKEKSDTRHLILGMFLFYAIFYLDNAHVSRWMPWFARRHLPIVIPSFIIFAVYFCFEIFELIPRNRFFKIFSRIKLNRVMKLMPFVLLLVLFASSIKVSTVLFNHVDYEGVSEQITELAETVGNSTIILGDEYIGHILVIPLKYTHNKDARILYGPEYMENMSEVIMKCHSEGKRVLLINNVPPKVFMELGQYAKWHSIGNVTISLEVIEKPNDRIPKQNCTIELVFLIFEIELYEETTLNATKSDGIFHEPNHNENYYILPHEFKNILNQILFANKQRSLHTSSFYSNRSI